MAKSEKATFDPRLLNEMRVRAPLNLEKAQELADEFDTKVKSVIAKALREKIPYVKQVRVQKNGNPVASKNTIVGNIEENLSLDAGSLDGLEKASKASLEILSRHVAVKGFDEEFD